MSNANTAISETISRTVTSIALRQYEQKLKSEEARRSINARIGECMAELIKARPEESQRKDTLSAIR